MEIVASARATFRSETPGARGIPPLGSETPRPYHACMPGERPEGTELVAHPENSLGGGGVGQQSGADSAMDRLWVGLRDCVGMVNFVHNGRRS